METNKWSYYNVVGGRLTTKLKTKPTQEEIDVINQGKPITQYVERVNKEGVTVHEIATGTISNVLLRGVRFKTDNYGYSLEIKGFSEKDGNVVITVNTDSNYFRSFASRLPNINTEFPVDINIYVMEKDGKTSRGLWFKQGDIKVQPYYTRETPNGLPPVNVVKTKTKDIYDYTAQIEFYEALMQKTFPDFARVDTRTNKPTATTVTGTASGTTDGSSGVTTTIGTSQTDAYLKANADFAAKPAGKKEAMTVPVGNSNEVMEKLPWDQ
mgnify:FL=1